jgi:hypothetical protein
MGPRRDHFRRSYSKDEDSIRWKDNIPRFLPPEPSHEQVIKSEQLQGERQVPSISKERHLKNVNPITPSNLISPFWVGIIIPHFPEKGCHKDTQPKGKDGSPFTLAGRFGQRSIAEPNIDGFNNENRQPY